LKLARSPCSGPSNNWQPADCKPSRWSRGEHDSGARPPSHDVTLNRMHGGDGRDCGQQVGYHFGLRHTAQATAVGGGGGGWPASACCWRELRDHLGAKAFKANEGPPGRPRAAGSVITRAVIEPGRGRRLLGNRMKRDIGFGPNVNSCPSCS